MLWLLTPAACIGKEEKERQSFEKELSSGEKGDFNVEWLLFSYGFLINNYGTFPCTQLCD